MPWTPQTLKISKNQEESKYPHDSLSPESVAEIYAADDSDDKLAAILQLELMARVQDMANLRYKYFTITTASRKND